MAVHFRSNLLHTTLLAGFCLGGVALAQGPNQVTPNSPGAGSMGKNNPGIGNPGTSFSTPGGGTPSGFSGAQDMLKPSDGRNTRPPVKDAAKPPVKGTPTVNVGPSPAQKEIEGLKDKLGIEGVDAIKEKQALQDALGKPGEDPRKFPDPQTPSGGTGPIMTLADPDEKAADGRERSVASVTKVLESYRGGHSDQARSAIDFYRYRADGSRAPVTTDRPSPVGHTEGGTLGIIIQSRWEADGVRYVLTEKFGARRGRTVESTGYSFHRSRGAGGLPETIYTDGEGEEIGRVAYAPGRDDPAMASNDGGNSWEPYRDTDGDGRHDGWTNTVGRANPPSGSATDSASTSPNSNSGNSNAGASSSSSSSSSSSAGTSTTNQGQNPNANNSAARDKQDRPDTASHERAHRDAGSPGSSGGTDNTPQDNSNTQPNENVPSKRDFFGEMGVAHPGGRPKEERRGPLVSGLAIESGVIIAPTRPRTPEEMKQMVTQPGEGSEGPARGGQARGARDFMQPAIDGTGGRVLVGGEGGPKEAEAAGGIKKPEGVGQ